MSTATTTITMLFVVYRCAFGVRSSALTRPPAQGLSLFMMNENWQLIIDKPVEFEK